MKVVTQTVVDIMEDEWEKGTWVGGDMSDRVTTQDSVAVVKNGMP